jgi:hypothetical protein
MTLNDLPPEEQLEPEPEWTPAQGLRRGVCWAAIMIVILGIATWPVVALAPIVLLQALLRATAAFLAYWLIYSVLERKTGQAGLVTTLLTLGATFGWLGSHHVALAVQGPVLLSSTLALHGWEWLDPGVILAINVWVVPALIPAIVFCWRGAPGVDALTDFFNQKMRP